MKFINSKSSYGLLTIANHWIMALIVIGMFALGLYMEDLNYSHEWYKSAPHIHKSVGFIFAVLLSFRVIWRQVNITPEAAPGVKRWEDKIAHLAHMVLYLVPFALIVSGYLISTADGRSIEVFNWFEIPAIFPASKGREDIAGEIHELLAFSLIIVAAAHALAALKHHFISKDRTLVRMLKP
ncbi:MAG: cytochrome b [Pseudomonas marincola]